MNAPSPDWKLSLFVQTEHPQPTRQPVVFPTSELPWEAHVVKGYGHSPDCWHREC